MDIPVIKVGIGEYIWGNTGECRGINYTGFYELLRIKEVPFRDIPVNMKVGVQGIHRNTLEFRGIQGNTGEYWGRRGHTGEYTGIVSSQLTFDKIS